MGFLLLIFLVFFAPLLLFVGQYRPSDIRDYTTNIQQHGLQLLPAWEIGFVRCGQGWTPMDRVTSGLWLTQALQCPNKSKWTICWQNPGQTVTSRKTIESGG